MREETYFLSHLLPYSLGSRKGRTLVLQSLKEYLFLLIATEQALESFRLGKLTDFDALVGENACQIRAVKLALIVRENKLDVLHLMKNVLESKKIVEEHINNNLSQFKKGPVSLACIFAKDPIDIDLCYRGLYLVKTYILTIIKEFDTNAKNKLLGNDFTNIKKIKSLFNIGTMFAEKLIKRLRKELSAKSCSFVKRIANDIDFLKDKKFSLHDFLVDLNGLTYIPCYWNMAILLQKVLKEKIPIVLLIDQKAKDNDHKVLHREKFIFQTNSNGCKQISESQLDDNQPVIVFYGSACRNAEEFSDLESWRKDLLKHSPTDLILACSAAHPQYPECAPIHLSEIIQTENSYKHYLFKAQQLGCDLNNPSCFFLSHVFCDQANNI